VYAFNPELSFRTELHAWLENLLAREQVIGLDPSLGLLDPITFMFHWLIIPDPSKNITRPGKPMPVRGKILTWN